MTLLPTHFGPGPERITNEWLNEMAGLVQNQALTLRLVPNVVLYGGSTLQAKVGSDLFVDVQSGEVTCFGQAVTFPSMSLMAEIPAGMEGAPLYFMWVYIDEKAELTSAVQTTPQWPRYTDGEGLVHDLTVLSLELFGPSGTNGSEWKEHHDLRRFSRTYSNGAVLVVGDLDAGADFETIQQAMDYLASADASGKAVPRNVLVATDQVVQEPIKVRTNGVSLHGVRARSQLGGGAAGAVVVTSAVAGATQALQQGAQTGAVKITWTYKGAGTVEQGAIIDVGGFRDFDMQDLRFEHQDTDPWCYVHNPGDGFRLQGCMFGDPELDSPVSVVVNFVAPVTRRVEVTGNGAFGLRRGLFGFLPGEQKVGGAQAAQSAACIAHSNVSRNYISVADVQDWPVDRPEKLFFAIDMGVGAGKDDCVYNVLRGNIVIDPFCGIRLGPYSTASANVVRGCKHLGIVVGSSGSTQMFDEQAMGATEVTGNGIELAWYDGAPWWRAGVRLEATDCNVCGNTVIVGSQGGCGVVHGPLVMSDRAAMMQEMAALRDGRHSVTGNCVIMTSVDGQIRHDLTDTRQGIGVALVSVGNRVSANGIFHARTGVLVMAGSTVSDNVISPAVVGVLAWSCNTVSGNAIGWLPHTSPGIPWALAEYSPTGAILLSNDNVCDGNTVRCGIDDSSGQEPPAAVSVKDWPGTIFGPEWSKVYESVWGGVPMTQAPLQAGLVGRKAGDNVISGMAIDLSNPSGILGEPSGTFRANGIVLDGEEGRSNIVSGVSIRCGLKGVASPAGRLEAVGCSFFHCLDRCIELGDAPRSVVSGCLLYSATGQPLLIGAGSPDSRLDDCLVMRTMQTGSDNISLRPAIDLEADRAQVCDCAIVNHSGSGIEWAGSFGECSGCWFYTRNPSVDWDPATAPLQSDGFFPAIRFATKLDSGQAVVPSTQGNLVTAAHMLNCSPLATNVNSTTSSPIQWLNAFAMSDTPAPPATTPQYLSQRWQSMVSLPTCYYRAPGAST